MRMCDSFLDISCFWLFADSVTSYDPLGTQNGGGNATVYEILTEGGPFNVKEINDYSVVSLWCRTTSEKKDSNHIIYVKVLL